MKDKIRLVGLDVHKDSISIASAIETSCVGKSTSAAARQAARKPPGASAIGGPGAAPAAP